MALFSSARTQLRSSLHQADRPLSNVCWQCRRQLSSQGTFEANDVILLKRLKLPQSEGKILKLRPGKKLGTSNGDLLHDDIIGKPPRTSVHTRKGYAFRVFQPTLEEYARLSPRICTPIYPGDANLITSFFDLHATPGTEGDDSKIEVLEAGSGHGALTLYLARAIHAANPPKPQLKSNSQFSPFSANSHVYQIKPDLVSSEDAADLEQPKKLEEWRKTRRAIIHSIDDVPSHTKWARGVVNDFRHGLYAGNVDFKTADVSDWLAAEAERRQSTEPFLTHAILDLPSTPNHLLAVSEALRIGGTLIVWNPSITQAAECVQLCKEQGLPLYNESTVECVAGQTGGRPWAVKAVKTRPREKSMAALRRRAEAEAPLGGVDEGNAATPQSTSANAVDDPGRRQASVDSTEDELSADTAESSRDNEGGQTVISCRPAPGERVMGGGFITVFRKIDPLS